MVIVPSRQLPQCSDAQRHSGRQAAVGIALQAAVGAVSAAGTVERCAQLAPPPPAAGRAGASNRFIDSSRPYASDDVVDHGKQLATEAVANAAASNVPVVIDGRPPIRNLCTRDRMHRTQRDLSRPAEPDEKFIVSEHGKFACSCFGNNSCLSPLRGHGLEL